MKQTISIEIPHVSDLPLLTKWGSETRELRAYEANEWHSEETLRDYIQNPKDDFLRVAKMDGKVVGMILVNVLRNWAYADFLYVDKNFRKRGVGETLVSAAFKHVFSRGLDTIHLVTHPESQSVYFYDKLGFEKGDTLIWVRKKISE